MHSSALIVVLCFAGGDNTKSATMAAQSRQCTWFTVSDPASSTLRHCLHFLCGAALTSFLTLLPSFHLLCRKWQRHTAVHDLILYDSRLGTLMRYIWHALCGMLYGQAVDGALGAVLPIWKVLAEQVIPAEDKKFTSDVEGPKGKDHARVVRLKLDSGEPIIGLTLMSDDVQKVGAAFAKALSCTASWCLQQSELCIGNIDPSPPVYVVVPALSGKVCACLCICCLADVFFEVSSQTSWLCCQGDGCSACKSCRLTVVVAPCRFWLQ